MEVLQQLELLIAEHSLIAAFVLIVSATLVSEDLTCIGCGLLVARGDLGLATALASCIFGLWFGDLTLYGWGTFVGRPALKRRPLRWWFSPEDVEKCAAWYRRRGSIVIFLAITYASCQGLTLRGRVWLCDTLNPHFSVKHLYVGASRATSAELLSVL